MKKIIIIEDEEILRNLLHKKLSAEGYDVVVAVNGEDGLQKIREENPDLVLLDIVMPKMDGFEMLEKLRKDEEIKDTLVVIISNSGQPVEIDKAQKFGVKDWLVKTEFDPQEVLDKVEAQIGPGNRDETDYSDKEDIDKEIDEIAKEEEEDFENKMEEEEKEEMVEEKDVEKKEEEVEEKEDKIEESEIEQGVEEEKMTEEGTESSGEEVDSKEEGEEDQNNFAEEEKEQEETEEAPLDDLTEKREEDGDEYDKETQEEDKL